MSSARLRIQTETIQRAVSDPRVSAWVHANAGSGKTYVLAQRVIRLLLSGVDPSRILCLTFTKAAAANMSLRVFAILSKWTALNDLDLRSEIESTGFAGEVVPEDARRLFARAVETPGGLKIQTIHAFCERILHLFPFEANVPARFEALDDEQHALLMSEAREQTLQTAIAEEHTELGKALRRVASEATGDAFTKLLREALKKREAIADATALQSGEFERRLGAVFGLRKGENLESISGELLDGGPGEAEWRAAIAQLFKSSAADIKLGRNCEGMLSAPGRDEKLAALKLIFFNNDGDERKAKSLVTKDMNEGVKLLFATERTRAVPLFDKLKSARAVERSVALQRLADAVISSYTRLKQVRGLLDFDDLIDRTVNLLQRSEASWVLYKLDRGIDHVLVDEAQDTSPKQWSILKALVDEFFSGASARDNIRTIFAVGDEKQSIFSFQGAEPKEFSLSKEHFAKKIEGADLQFVPEELKVSFRSTETVLTAVDTVFSVAENFNGLSYSDAVKTEHSAFKEGLPGLVELWPAIAAQENAEPEPWTMPLDKLSGQSPAAVLARRIARHIGTLTAPGSLEAVHDKDGKRRTITPGDIMILVRRRNAFFDEVIRALKRAGVPVAGADRLKLMEHIAVKDLVAAGHAALLPQDDFTLACLLKTPFFSFDDNDLLRLAPKRKGPLIAQLHDSSEQKDREAAKLIAEWGKAARTLGPYRFYARILSAEHGRHAMLARLGAEAGDAMDEFLRLALQWERENTSSLSSFLHSMQGADVEVKRDMEAAGEAVRVMTVHAAKGLEAKIVFLPDTCGAPSSRHDPSLIELETGDGKRAPVWRQNKKSDPPAVDAEMNCIREAAAQEYRRLLYVAMTRAEERLYICGYYGKKPDDGCWYHMIDATLTAGMVECPAPWDANDSILRTGEAAQLEQATVASAAAEISPPPAWLFAAAAPERAPPPPLRPSQATAAADQIETDVSGAISPRPLALLEGNLVHALLQHLPSLPEENRAAAAVRFLAQRGEMLTVERRMVLAANVLAVMNHPGCADLFGPLSRAEVAIAGRALLPNRQEIEISGRIDRLAVSAKEVLIADFKTGSPPSGATPAAYIAQLALYRAALRAAVPGQGGPRLPDLDSCARGRRT